MVTLAALAACTPTEPEPPAEPAVRLVCDRDYLPTFRSVVGDATDTIAITQWELFEGTATDQVVALLGEAVERDVTVRVMLDETIEDNAVALDRLLALGVDARFDGSDDKLHAKMVIGDDRALAGSTNWSTASIDYNRECNFDLQPGPPADYLKAWYDDIWDNPYARSTPEGGASDDLTTALVDDDLLPILLDQIDVATDRVDFTLYATYLQPDNLSSPAMQVFGALADAASRGVPVRGVADFADWNPGNTESNEEAVNWLRARGVEMRWDRPGINLHAKTFAMDDVLQVQSANVSTSGFEINREVGGRTTEETALADFDAWFDELWDESTEAQP